MLKSVLLSSVTLAAVGVIATGAAQPALSQSASIGSLPQGSQGFAIAATMARVMSERAGLDARAVGQGGSNVFLPQVNLGELEFGTSNTFEAIFAHTGQGNFDGRPLENLRMVAAVAPFMTGIMVRADSDIQSVEDLAGQPFPTDYTSQRLVSVMLDTALAMAGMTTDDLTRVPVPNFVQGAELTGSGEVVGAFLAPGSAVVSQADAAVGVRFISLPTGEDAERILSEGLPSAYLVTVEPGIAGVVEPTVMIGYEYVLVTNADVSDELVYETVKALHEGQEDLAAGNAAFADMNVARMAVALDGIDYHPGAEAYFREVGLWPSE